MKGGKKEQPPEIHICYLCGREIYGDYAINRTRRKSTLHMHYGCVKAEMEKNQAEGHMSEEDDNEWILCYQINDEYGE